ncbi:hypothetical protein BDR03DRAFT_954790 [Suillus americanus]|nr:hypothetical protein BDR03DRAFT_954790 [Suillus americanus]
MVDVTPPADEDTSLTVYDHNNQQVQAGNILYDLIHVARITSSRCPGLLEAIAIITFPSAQAPDPNSPLVQDRISHISRFLWTGRLGIRCTDRSDYGYTSEPNTAGIIYIHLNRQLVAAWSRKKTGGWFRLVKWANNYHLLKFAVHLVAVHEYIHAIMFRFAAPAGTPDIIRGARGEAGYWAEDWLTGNGRAYFLYNRGQTLVFDQICAVHFANADGHFLELKKADRKILKALAAGQWRPFPQNIRRYPPGDWPRIRGNRSDRSRTECARSGQTS